MNASGHRSVNKTALIVVAVTAAAAAIGMGWHWLLLVAGYLFATFWCDPDRDQRRRIEWRKIYTPAELWDLVWAPYAKNTVHRGPSHWPGWGAFSRLWYLVRIALVGWLIAGVWQNAGELSGDRVFWMLEVIAVETLEMARKTVPYWGLFWLGMTLADTIHLGMDLSSTDVKRTARKIKQQNGR